MSVLDFKGGQIHYSIKGSGKAVVLLHGFLEDATIWKEYSDILSQKYLVICPDMPGHGKSSNFGYCHSMEFMAEVVMAILKQHNIRKFHLIGHSMGGYISMAIAEKHPDNIRGICLFHSTADSDSDKKQKERLKVIKVVQKKKDFFISESIPNLFNTKFKPYKSGIASISNMAKSMSVQGIIAAIEGMRIRKNREIVMKFAPYPVLYLIGKEDNILPFDKLITESNLTENAEYVLMQNCGHMGFIEDKEACIEAIGRFLKRKPKIF